MNTRKIFIIILGEILLFLGGMAVGFSVKYNISQKKPTQLVNNTNQVSVSLPSSTQSQSSSIPSTTSTIPLSITPTTPKITHGIVITPSQINIDWPDTQSLIQQCKIEKLVYFHIDCPGNSDYTFVYLKNNSSTRLEMNNTPSFDELKATAQAVSSTCGVISVSTEGHGCLFE